MEVVKRRGYDRAACEIDKTRLPQREGKLKKLNRHGYWQARYFVLNNHFLNYFSKASKLEMLGSIDLMKVRDVEPTDMGGTFELRFHDSDDTYRLRAASYSEGVDWIQAIRRRLDYYKSDDTDSDASPKQQRLPHGIRPPQSTGYDSEVTTEPSTPVSPSVIVPPPPIIKPMGSGSSRTTTHTTTTTTTANTNTSTRPVNPVTLPTATTTTVTSITHTASTTATGSTFPKQGSSGGKSGIPQWLRQLIEASPDERDELTDAVVAPLIANVVTRTDVMFEPMIDVTESIQELLEKRLEAISRVKSSWDRNSIAKHQLHFLTSIIDRLYTNFIPKVTPSGLALNVADAVTAVAGDGSRDHETNPYELSLSQLRDMIYALEDFQLSRWRLLKKYGLIDTVTRDKIQEHIDASIERYVDASVGKLHQLMTTMLQRQISDKSPDAVSVAHGTWLGTKFPTDMFMLILEFLGLVNKLTSPSLYRRLFSSALVEIMMFCNSLSDDVTVCWSKAPGTVSLDYVCALVNDMGAVLDRLEQFALSYNAALQLEQKRRREVNYWESKTSLVDMPEDGGVSEHKDGVDDGVAEGTVTDSDLLSFQEDLPRILAEIAKCGLGGVAILRNMVLNDCKGSLDKLFTPEWLKDDISGTVCLTCKEYFDDVKPNLDPFFMERLGESVLLHLVERYVSRFVTIASEKYWFSSFKMSLPMVGQLAADMTEITLVFGQYVKKVSMDGIVRVVQPVMQAMLTASVSDLKKLSSHCFDGYPTSSYHVMKLFELCLNSRGDLSKSERKELIGSCVASVIATGFPPDDDDWPLIIDPDVLLPHWDCNMALQKILHTAFPLARTQATEFFASHGIDRRVTAVPTKPSTGSTSPVVLSMDQFLSGCTTPTAASKKIRRMGSDGADGFTPARKPLRSTMTQWKDGGDRRGHESKTHHDDDDEPVSPVLQQRFADEFDVDAGTVGQSSVVQLTRQLGSSTRGNRGTHTLTTQANNNGDDDDDDDDEDEERSRRQALARARRERRLEEEKRRRK